MSPQRTGISLSVSCCPRSRIYHSMMTAGRSVSPAAAGVAASEERVDRAVPREAVERPGTVDPRAAVDRAVPREAVERPGTVDPPRAADRPARAAQPLAAPLDLVAHPESADPRRPGVIPGRAAARSMAAWTATSGGVSDSGAGDAGDSIRDARGSGDADASSEATELLHYYGRWNRLAIALLRSIAAVTSTAQFSRARA